MNLLFDIGNTRVKVAREEDGSLHSLPSISSTVETAFPPDWESKVPDAIYLASVANDEINHRVCQWANDRWQLDVKTIAVQQDLAGIHTRYEKPETLGVDRWLAALGAYHIECGQGICVIDAGTALTVDVVDNNGVHHGGLIAPGLELMIRSLTNNTAQLALENISVPDIFAVDTQTAISLGCADYVAGMIQRATERIATAARRRRGRRHVDVGRARQRRCLHRIYRNSTAHPQCYGRKLCSGHAAHCGNGRSECHDRAGLRPREGAGRGRRPRQDLQGCRFRLARTRLLHVPCHERRRAGFGRALRFQYQSELRGPAG